MNANEHRNHSSNGTAPSASDFSLYASILPTRYSAAADCFHQGDRCHHHPHTRSSLDKLIPIIEPLTKTELYRYLESNNVLSALDDDNSTQYTHLAALPTTTPEVELQLTCLLLLSTPAQTFACLPSEVQEAISRVLDSSKLPAALQDELNHLRKQLGILSEYCMYSDDDNAHIDNADASTKEKRLHDEGRCCSIAKQHTANE